MRFVEFLIIPLLIVGYLFFVDFIVANNVSVPGISQVDQFSSPGATEVKFGEALSVVAMRPYFNGLIRLPTYTGSLGYIGWMHDLFFNFVMLLAVSFVAFEIYLTIRGKKEVSYMKNNWNSSQTRSFDWMRLAKAAAAGIVFWIAAAMLSGDTASIALGLLVAYLEYRRQG